MRRLICLIMFAGLQGISQAIMFQNNGPVIKGKVSDINGSPLPGAGITIENTFLGVHTDSEGNYTLSVPKNGVYLLRFSFIGYESQFSEVRVKGDTVLNITLM